MRPRSTPELVGADPVDDCGAQSELLSSSTPSREEMTVVPGKHFIQEDCAPAVADAIVRLAS